MIITEETSIKELFHENMISLETYSILNSKRLTTVGMILGFIGDAKKYEHLLTINGIGNKNYLQILKVISSLDRKNRKPKKMSDTIQNIRNGTNVGSAHPEFIKVELKSAGSGNMPDMDVMINRYDKDIAKALLADFFLTQQKSGNSAGFTSSKIKTFTNLVKEMLDEICRVINHKLIPDLISKNLMDITLCPELTHT